MHHQHGQSDNIRWLYHSGNIAKRVDEDKRWKAKRREKEGVENVVSISRTWANESALVDERLW